MYRKPRNPNKRRAIQQARRELSPPMHRAMAACRMARSVGLMVLSAHAISGRATVVVSDPNYPTTRTEWRL